MATPRRNVQKELDELRGQVAALAAGQKASAVEPESEEDEAPAHEVNLKERFEELFQSLERDINETPATTCLAIFALGVLVGRTLAS